MGSNILDISKNIGIKHNVSLRVLDRVTGQVVQEHTGHNAATNSMLLGIGYYLIGNGVLGQGHSMLSRYVPQYISLGTMGLVDQEEDEEGLPSGIGVVKYQQKDESGNVTTTYGDLSDTSLKTLGKLDDGGNPMAGYKPTDKLTNEDDEVLRFADYMTQSPGYGADGYDINTNNGRTLFGLGPMFKYRPDKSKTINCELVTPSFPRVQISYRDVVPEDKSEFAQTIDIVFSAMISTGALRQFREPGKDYIYITEAGLWSRKDWNNSGSNGLLAGYRVAPPDEVNWDMTNADNRKILKENVLRVGVNQVVQVVWKVQLGSVEQLTGIYKYYEDLYPGIQWKIHGTLEEAEAFEERDEFST